MGVAETIFGNVQPLTIEFYGNKVRGVCVSGGAPRCVRALKTHRPRGAALYQRLLLITPSFPLSCLISTKRLSFFQRLRFFALTSNNNNKTSP